MSGTTTTFAYNGNGLRDSRTQGSAVTFTWDVALSIPQVLDDGSFKYVYGIGRIAEVSGSGTWYYLPDGLGSTMALVDASGSVVNTYDYDVFGAIRQSTGSQPNEFKFTGEQVDPTTGAAVPEARYYDQATGRFISKDALEAIVELPGSQNRYLYVLNNATNLLDPSGLSVFGLQCPKPIKKVVSAFETGYVDINIAGCFWVCGTVGVQFGKDQGFHVYAGGGLGNPGGGIGVNVFPGQSITEGLACGVQAATPIYPFPAGVGIGGEIGFGGISVEFKESFPTFDGTFYIGGGLYIGTPGVAGTCYFVSPSLFLSGIERHD